MKSLRSIFTGLVLIFLAAGGAALMWKGGVKMVAARTFSDAFPLKTKFVCLNGGVCRVLGRRLCNGVYRAEDGLLLSGFSPRSTSQIARSAIDFSTWLESRGIGYLFVLTPAKIDLQGKLAPPDSVFPSGANVTTDAFLDHLRRGGVDVVDLRPLLTATQADVRRHFYRTDHHWNNDAVFASFAVLSDSLARRTGADSARVASLTDPSAWTRVVWPKCFLGSKGRRTGWLFSGFDDMIVYTPRFQTEMAIDIPSQKIHLRGSFKKTNMWRAKTIRGKKGRSYTRDAYSALYTGGIYPFVRHQNDMAPIPAKILIIGDSYVRPLEAFLSTTVREIVVIDPRRIDRTHTLVQYVEHERPDFVLQIQNPSALGADAIGQKRTGRPVMFEYGLASRPGE